MIEKKTLINQIQITRTGRLQVRLALQIEENGVVIGEPKYHRTAIDPGGDPVAVFDLEDASITRNLVWAPINRDDGMFACLQATCAVLHTPDVVLAYRAAIEEARAAADQAMQPVVVTTEQPA